jgi:hypothetical protein
MPADPDQPSGGDNSIPSSNWPDGTEILHILPQRQWHDPAWIVGTRGALTALRDALTAAIALPETEGRAPAVVCDAMANDGEGYGVVCRVVSQATMDSVPFGYSDEIAAGGIDWPRWLEEGAFDRQP